MVRRDDERGPGRLEEVNTHSVISSSALSSGYNCNRISLEIADIDRYLSDKGIKIFVYYTVHAQHQNPPLLQVDLPCRTLAGQGDKPKHSCWTSDCLT